MKLVDDYGNTVTLNGSNRLSLTVDPQRLTLPYEMFKLFDRLHTASAGNIVKALDLLPYQFKQLRTHLFEKTTIEVANIVFKSFSHAFLNYDPLHPDETVAVTKPITWRIKEKT